MLGHCPTRRSQCQGRSLSWRYILAEAKCIEVLGSLLSWRISWRVIGPAIRRTNSVRDLPYEGSKLIFLRPNLQLLSDLSLGFTGVEMRVMVQLSS